MKTMLGPGKRKHHFVKTKLSSDKTKHGFEETKLGPRETKHHFRKTKHGPEETKHGFGEKESPSGESERVSRRNEFAFLRRQLPNASRWGGFGQRFKGMGVIALAKANEPQRRGPLRKS